MLNVSAEHLRVDILECQVAGIEGHSDLVVYQPGHKRVAVFSAGYAIADYCLTAVRSIFRLDPSARRKGCHPWYSIVVSYIIEMICTSELETGGIAC